MGEFRRNYFAAVIALILDLSHIWNHFQENTDKVLPSKSSIPEMDLDRNSNSWIKRRDLLQEFIEADKEPAGIRSLRHLNQPNEKQSGRRLLETENLASFQHCMRFG